MTFSLFQMFLLIAFGAVWRYVMPGGLDATSVRKALTGLVYYLLLPALILEVMWRSGIDSNSFRIAILAIIGVLSAIALALFSCRVCRASRTTSGAVLLAAAFPNASYLGIPVLEQTFGPWARSVAIQYDLLACSPLVLTVGVLIARNYGVTSLKTSVLADLLKVPPLWAMVIAVALNMMAVPAPEFLIGVFELLGRSVTPLMLLSLGMGLNLKSLKPSNLMPILPVVVIQLGLMPLIVFAASHMIGLPENLQAPVVLEAAMPTMLLGVVIADRFNLDTDLYAAAVTITTAISMFSLPFWYGLVV